jgi:aryl-alcohol dehydrogenase-like predicted oxidoreductase
MESRRLGATGLISSAIGLGSAAFTGIYGPVTEVDCIQTVRLALDMGITMFDAAGFHPGDEVTGEELVGAALSEHRGEALIATQVRRPLGGKSIRTACDESLRRLRTEYIDILYLPRGSGGLIEESMNVLADLAAAGKVRYAGLCAPTAGELRRAHAVHPVSVVAVAYSLRHRAAEMTLLPAARELGVGVVACRPLDGGVLTGRSPSAAAVADVAALRAIEDEAAALNLGIARLALAWLLSRQGDVVPVPSTRSPAHAEMNASAASILLPSDARARLSELFTSSQP